MTMHPAQQMHDQSSIDRRCGQSNVTEHVMGSLRTGNLKQARAIARALKTTKAAPAPAAPAAKKTKTKAA